MRRDGARRAALVCAIVATVALALGACGDDSESGGPSKRPHLKVGLATPAVILDFVAEGKGFFEQAGVDVDVDGGTGSNTQNLVTSGQLDIGSYASTGPLLIAKQGRATSIPYAVSGGGIGGVVVGNPERAPTLDRLRSLDRCRLGAFPEGSSSYGYATLYRQRLKLDCDVVPFQDNTALLGALAAGRIDAVVSAYSNVAKAVRERRLPILVDTRDPAQRAKYIGANVIEIIVFGMRDRLRGKRDAVQRYLRALDRARTYTADPAHAAEIAGLLAKRTEFAGQTAATLKTDVVDSFRAYLPAAGDKGYIAKSLWDASLKRYATWSVPGFDAAAPWASYADAIDMSYYERALGKP